MRNIQSFAVAIILGLFAAAPLVAPAQDAHQHEKSAMTCCAKDGCCVAKDGKAEACCSTKGGCCAKDMKCCSHEKGDGKACCKAGEGCCAKGDQADKCCANCKHA